MNFKEKFPLTNEGEVISASFFYFTFAALYGKIFSVSFLSTVALYDHNKPLTCALILFLLFSFVNEKRKNRSPMRKGMPLYLTALMK